MRPYRQLFAALVLSLCLIWMSGCVGSSAPTKLYVLTPAPKAEANPPGAEETGSPVLGVGPVRLPGLLDQPQIVTRRSADEIGRAEFDRWAEPLADTVPRVIAENLAALWGSNRVAIFPWDPAQPVQYQVVVDVMRFDGAMGGDVVLDARWRIVTTEGRELAVRRSVLTQQTGRAGYLAVVTAMSHALASLSQEIAATFDTLSRAGGDARTEAARSRTGADSCGDQGSGSARDLQRSPAQTRSNK